MNEATTILTRAEDGQEHCRVALRKYQGRSLWGCFTDI